MKAFHFANALPTSSTGAEEPNQSKDIYCAPRLVSLGTTVGLVQFSTVGTMFDSQVGNGRRN